MSISEKLVTDEMIDAGIAAMDEHDRRLNSKTVSAIYLAMEAARQVDGDMVERVARAITSELGMDPDAALPCSDLFAWQLNEHTAHAALSAAGIPEILQQKEEVERGWILPKPSPLACYPCGLPYSGEHWVEAVVADDVWQRISPSGDSGGILCVNCMAARLHHLGLDRVQVKLTAGPFCDSHSQLERATEALGTISSQAICYGMRADETELRDWLKHISETAEEALAAIKEGGL